MTFLSCLGVGIAFAVAVLLLVFAGVVLGLVVPVGKRPRDGEDG